MLLLMALPLMALPLMALPLMALPLLALLLLALPLLVLPLRVLPLLRLPLSLMVALYNHLTIALRMNIQQPSTLTNKQATQSVYGLYAKGNNVSM